MHGPRRRGALPTGQCGRRGRRRAWAKTRPPGTGARTSPPPPRAAAASPAGPKSKVARAVCLCPLPHQGLRRRFQPPAARPMGGKRRARPHGRSHSRTPQETRVRMHDLFVFPIHPSRTSLQQVLAVFESKIDASPRTHPQNSIPSTNEHLEPPPGRNSAATDTSSCIRISDIHLQPTYLPPAHLPPAHLPPAHLPLDHLPACPLACSCHHPVFLTITYNRNPQ